MLKGTEEKMDKMDKRQRTVPENRNLQKIIKWKFYNGTVQYEIDSKEDRIYKLEEKSRENIHAIHAKTQREQ